VFHSRYDHQTEKEAHPQALFFRACRPGQVHVLLCMLLIVPQFQVQTLLLLDQIKPIGQLVPVN
jgi:hypothetical protein